MKEMISGKEIMHEIFQAEVQTTLENLELRIQKKTLALKPSVSRQP